MDIEYLALWVVEVFMNYDDFLVLLSGLIGGIHRR